MPQDDETAPAARNIPNPFIDELTSQLCGSPEHRASRYNKQSDVKGNEASEAKGTKSKQTSAPKDAVMENNSPTEYSAPFSPKGKAIPVAHPVGGGISVQHIIQSRSVTQNEVEEHEYEGVGSLPMPVAATPGPKNSDVSQTSTSSGGKQVWSTTHPSITAEYSQLEIVQEEYSHLQHT